MFSSCMCCMFVSCVHVVAVLNAAFCMVQGLGVWSGVMSVCIVSLDSLWR